jgi:dihydrofolate synthase / folylpolyglutamate synthase
VIITPIKTEKVTAGSITLLSLLGVSVRSLQEGDVLAVTSKIVSLCEGNVVPVDGTDREALIVRESDYHLPKGSNKYGHHFTITDHTLIAAAGIDVSNGDGQYVLWPKDSQTSANRIRAYLRERFRLRNVGVVITDSTSQPMRRGTTGIAMAHSGFKSVNDYIGQPDLFGRAIDHSQANVSGGLAAAAVLAMGEGSEQTPLCVLSDLPFVQFQDQDPTADELAIHQMEVADDLFAPFLDNAGWLPGERSKERDIIES